MMMTHSTVHSDGEWVDDEIGTKDSISIESTDIKLRTFLEMTSISVVEIDVISEALPSILISERLK